jgi:ATP-dependent Clp protease ATP-binding subunit ClpB
LSRDDILRIVELQLAHLERLLADRHLGLEVSTEAKQLLAAQGYDPVYGARPLKRAIQRLLQNPIALEVLEGRYHTGDVIRVDRQGDGLRFSRRSGVAEPVSA